MKTFKIGGVHPKDQKFSANKAIDTLALPKQAIIPLSQHIGAPASPVVAKGDYVRVGQLIAKATGFMSANIHSPYSGTIEKIDNTIKIMITHRLDEEMLNILENNSKFNRRTLIYEV